VDGISGAQASGGEWQFEKDRARCKNILRRERLGEPDRREAIEEE